MQRVRSGQSGFTLVEIIAVMVILGILTAVVVSRASTSSLIPETEVVKSHLRHAQMAAMKDNVPWGISFSGSSYTLQKNGATSTSSLPNDSSATHTLPSGVTVSSTVNPVNFDNLGSPGTATITVTLTEGGSNATFSVTRNTGLIQ